jgi:hypothetical protein
MKLAIPRINMNGNSKDSLLSELQLTTDALTITIKALSRCDYAHGRNFQTCPTIGEHEHASAQHRARMQKLLDVREELFTLAVEIDRQ